MHKNKYCYPNSDVLINKLNIKNLGKIIVITTIMMFVMLCIAEYCLS